METLPYTLDKTWQWQCVADLQLLGDRKQREEEIQEGAQMACSLQGHVHNVNFFQLSFNSYPSPIWHHHIIYEYTEGLIDSSMVAEPSWSSCLWEFFPDMSRGGFYWSPIHCTIQSSCQSGLSITEGSTILNIRVYLEHSNPGQTYF